MAKPDPMSSTGRTTPTWTRLSANSSLCMRLCNSKPGPSASTASITPITRIQAAPSTAAAPASPTPARRLAPTPSEPSPLRTLPAFCSSASSWTSRSKGMQAVTSVALRAMVLGWLMCSPAFSQSPARVVVDAWFNSQQRPNAAGQMEYFHYKWNDVSNSGFSLLGDVFHKAGVTTDTLYTAPTIAKLKGAQIYIIVSPDIPVKNPHPHYLQPEDARQVAEWVKQGGILVLMANDPANGEIEHLDLLADLFGIHFNPVLSHHVVGDNHEAGRIPVAGNGPVFQHNHTLFMKDTCTISVKGPAAPLLEDK